MKSGSWLSTKKVKEAAKLTAARIPLEREQRHAKARANWRWWRQWEAFYDNSKQRMANDIWGSWREDVAERLFAIANLTEDEKMFVSAEDFSAIQREYIR